jgi:hypothetical protein
VTSFPISPCQAGATIAESRGRSDGPTKSTAASVNRVSASFSGGTPAMGSPSLPRSERCLVGGGEISCRMTAFWLIVASSGTSTTFCAAAGSSHTSDSKSRTIRGGATASIRRAQAALPKSLGVLRAGMPLSATAIRAPTIPCFLMAASRHTSSPRPPTERALLLQGIKDRSGTGVQ